MCCVIWNNDMASSRLHFPHVKWAQSSLPSPSYRVGERTKWGSAFFYLKTKCLVDIKYYYHYYYYYYCYYSRTLIDPGINFRPLSFQESLVTIDWVPSFTTQSSITSTPPIPHMFFTPSPESVLHLPSQYLFLHYLLGQEFLLYLPPSVKIISILQDLCQTPSPLWNLLAQSCPLPFEFPVLSLYPVSTRHVLLGVILSYLCPSLSPQRHRMSVLSRYTTQGIDSGKYSMDDWLLEHSPFILRDKVLNFLPFDSYNSLWSR